MLIGLDFFGHFYASLTISSVRMCFVKGTEVSLLSGLDISHFSDSHRFHSPLPKAALSNDLKKKKKG